MRTEKKSMMYKENLGKCSVLEVSLCCPFPDPLTRESRVLLGLFWLCSLAFLCCWFLQLHIHAV